MEPIDRVFQRVVLSTIPSVSTDQERTEAEGEFGWPVGVTQSIDAPVGELWAAISAPGNLELCHPFCESNPVSVWPGAESQDEIHYLNGRVYQRHFVDWLDGVGYDLVIEESGRRVALVDWRIEGTSPTTSRLRITSAPLRCRTPRCFSAGFATWSSFGRCCVDI